MGKRKPDIDEQIEKKTEKLPSDLQTFAASLHNLEYCGELLGRLKDLPESNFGESIDSFNRAMKVVEQAEKAAGIARDAARMIAFRAWGVAVNNWTVKELQEATGYDRDD